MFFTLVSKLLLRGPAKNRDFLLVFILGSVMYVALHWYLHLEQKSGIVEQVKKYLYYTMAVDMIIAYIMVTFFSKQIDEQTDADDNNSNNSNNISPNPDENKNKPKREYTEEEKMIIMAKMQETRRQQMKERALAQQNASNANNNPNNPNNQNDLDHRQQNQGHQNHVDQQKNNNNNKQSKSDVQNRLRVKSKDLDDNDENNNHNNHHNNRKDPDSEGEVDNDEDMGEDLDEDLNEDPDEDQDEDQDEDLDEDLDRDRESDEDLKKIEGIIIEKE